MAKTQRTKEYEPLGTYQTGVTQPAKSYVGVIALLLMLVIFLCGIVTALGLMNIQLFRQNQANGTAQGTPLSFTGRSSENQQNLQEDSAGVVAFWELGLVAREMNGIYRSYYDLPVGIYITQVNADSPAARAGVTPGDVLTACNGQAMETTQQLQACLAGQQDIQFVVYRKLENQFLEIVLQLGK